MRISDWSSDVCSSDLVADSKADGRQGPVRDVRARRKACDAVWAGPEGEARRHGAARPEAGGRQHLIGGRKGGRHGGWTARRTSASTLGNVGRSHLKNAVSPHSCAWTAQLIRGVTSKAPT